MTEMYSYTSAGLETKKKLRLTRWLAACPSAGYASSSIGRAGRSTTAAGKQAANKARNLCMATV